MANKVQISGFELGAYYIALGETMLNKSVTLDVAQTDDQRDYVIHRLTMNGISVERAEEISAAALKGISVEEPKKEG